MTLENVTNQIVNYIEVENYNAAFALVKQHQHFHNNLYFNDAYATLLYCTGKYVCAKKVLYFNIEILKFYPNNTVLLSTYFLLSLCNLSLNYSKKAQFYLEKCHKLAAKNTELQKELLQLFN